MKRGLLQFDHWWICPLVAGGIPFVTLLIIQSLTTGTGSGDNSLLAVAAGLGGFGVVMAFIVELFLRKARTEKEGLIWVCVVTSIAAVLLSGGGGNVKGFVYIVGIVIYHDLGYWFLRSLYIRNFSKVGAS